MKRLFALAVLLLVTSCVSACGKETGPTLGLDETSAFDTTAATETVAETTEAASVPAEATKPAQLAKPKTESQPPQASGENTLQPAFAVTVKNPVTEQKGYDRETGKTLVLTFSYDSPTVTIPGREAVSKKINAFLRGLEDTYVSGVNYERDPAAAEGYEGRLAAAQDQYTACREEGSPFIPHSASRHTEFLRKDEKVVSALVHTETNSGSTHSYETNAAYVFSAETGELLTFSELAYDNQIFQDFLTDWMVKEAKADPKIQERIIWFGESLYPEKFRTLLRDGNWYLSDEELVIFSSTAEFGPEAAGTVSFHVPIKELDGMLNTHYI